MVKDKLVDEESRILYNIRNDYYRNEDYILFMQKILNINKNWFSVDQSFDDIRKLPVYFK